MSSKTQENEIRVLTETNINSSKINVDTKNQVGTRNTNRSQQSNINRTKSMDPLFFNNVNNENSVDGMSRKNDTKKDLEKTKNQINAKLNKNCTVNGLRYILLLY
jgi:hypothetical protein